ncbi:MAG: DUF1573 domain-containing protein [Flavobacteriales bacterium]|nr:DUF1573 domain-containing protein [Flavobacteriales bacterium]
MIFSDNDVSYDRSNTSAVTASNISSNATLPTVDNNAVVIPENTGPKTSIQFAEMEHDFGTIEQNTTNPKVFTFTNSGDTPLIISDAKGSCGCTVPDYPRQPIAPGETGEIKVVYSPGTQANQQSKSVTITANTEPATTVIRIKANVTPGENPTTVNPPLEITQ